MCLRFQENVSPHTLRRPVYLPLIVRQSYTFMSPKLLGDCSLKPCVQIQFHGIHMLLTLELAGHVLILIVGVFFFFFSPLCCLNNISNLIITSLHNHFRIMIYSSSYTEWITSSQWFLTVIWQLFTIWWNQSGACKSGSRKEIKHVLALALRDLWLMGIVRQGKLAKGREELREEINKLNH